MSGTLSCVVVVVFFLGVLCADQDYGGGNSTVGQDSYENACAFRGALEVFSTPAQLPVTATHCNIYYEMEVFFLPPTVKYLTARPGQLYTLFMLDPDAPDRDLNPRGVYLLHWLVANIPGEDLLRGDLTNSTEIRIYLPTTPTPGTGVHHYMIYIYLQLPPSAKISGSITDEVEIFFFDLKAYIEKTALQGVRLFGPLAGVQFRSAFSLEEFKIDQERGQGRSPYIIF